MLAGDAEILSDQCTGCDPSETDDDLRRHRCDLRIQPGSAGFDFIITRVTVMRRTAFDHVGDIDLRSVQVDQFEHGVQQFSGRTYEGDTLQIFLLTGTFSDEQDLGIGVPDSENQVRPSIGKAAPDTSGTGLTDLFHFRLTHRNVHLVSSGPDHRNGRHLSCIEGTTRL